MAERDRGEFSNPEVPESPLIFKFKGFDVGPIANLETFDMRNGDISDAKSLLVQQTIPPMFHWQMIQGLPPKQSFKHVDAYIQMVYAQIMTNKPADTTDSVARKLAIVVGTARAVTTELYDITEGHILVGEMAPAVLKATEETNQGYQIEVVPGTDENVAKLLSANLELDVKERAAISAAHMSAIGLLPLQGYSLLMTGHHYVSEGDNQSRRAFAVVERQNWASVKVNDWWVANENTLRDALWHKACHPIVLHYKRILAQSETVREMLRTAGAGAAAARLPALEPELRMAGSYMKLMKTVRPLFEKYGGELNLDLLQDATDCVKEFPAEMLREGPTLNPRLPKDTPAYVKDRRSALVYLKDVCDRNCDIVAYCYGFYCALAEQNAMSGVSAGSDSLRTSFSLRRLKSQSYASWVQGTQAYGDYAAAMNRP